MGQGWCDIPGDHGANDYYTRHEQHLPPQQAPALLDSARLAKTRSQRKEDSHLEHAERRGHEGGNHPEQGEGLYARDRG